MGHELAQDGREALSCRADVGCLELVIGERLQKNRSRFKQLGAYQVHPRGAHFGAPSRRPSLSDWWHLQAAGEQSAAQRASSGWLVLPADVSDAVLRRGGARGDALGLQSKAICERAN